MEFIFRPEKITENLFYEISEAVAKRAEIFSRRKLPGLWEKTDRLNENRLPEKALIRRRKFRRFYGIICIALGFFLFVPGLVKPDELFVPLVVGAVAMITGISAVIPRKTNAERYLKKAKKLAKAINSSIEKDDTVVFGDSGIFENGALLMKYEELENLIENRSIFLVCGGTKIMVLRKTDMVSGNPEEFGIFIESKTGRKIENCN
ncbi:MAG: hypothetical protein E7479_01935 [Ruminococcaceae bacterium]|nr:hypothetical protein [Oscillospiraceae bacterium]